jgi:hypothetical protein
MEYGFYHPDRGYWQAVDVVPDHIRATYPAGTIEVPLQPSRLHTWVGGAWVPPTEAELAAQAAAELDAARSQMQLSFAQLLIGLVTEAWITEAEGRAWRDRTALPAAVVALIGTLPLDQQFAAETRALAPSVVLRTDPLVQSLAAAQGKTAEQIDDFFTTYSEV